MTDEFSPSEIEDMKRRLSIHGSGANAHTANKAICYLSGRPNKLMPLCEAALNANQWGDLKKAMIHLW